MIRYALACPDAHAFESWFPSSDAYEAQRARGLVTCPVCDSRSVEKQVMAPAVGRSDRGTPPAPDAAPAPQAPAPPQAQPMALLGEREREVRAMLRAMREHVVRNAENVGRRFADEARRMHGGEIEHRSIYGEAAPAEAQALLEEGIEVHPLPIVPDDRN